MQPFRNARNVDYRNGRYRFHAGNQENHVHWTPWLYDGRYPHHDDQDHHVAQAPPRSQMHRGNRAEPATQMISGRDYVDARGIQLNQVGGRTTNHNRTSPPEIHAADVVRPSDIQLNQVGGRKTNHNHTSPPETHAADVVRPSNIQLNQVGGRTTNHNHTSPPETHTAEVVRPSNIQLNQIGGRTTNHNHTSPEIHAADVVRPSDRATHNNHATIHHLPTYQREPPPYIPTHSSDSDHFSMPSDGITIDSLGSTLDSRATIDDDSDMHEANDAPLSLLDSRATLDDDSAMYEVNDAPLTTSVYLPSIIFDQTTNPAAQRNTSDGFVSRYVLFDLDKEATKASLREWQRCDERILHAVDNMSDITYVGYIAKVCDRSMQSQRATNSRRLQPERGGDPNVFRVYLLRSGLPKKSISSDLCIAVLPNTDEKCSNKDEPQERQGLHYRPRQPRKPLRPAMPLPSFWGSCYHSLFESLLVRIPEIPEGIGNYELPRDERIRHGATNGHDVVSLARRQNNWLVRKRKNEPGNIVATTPSQAPLRQAPRVTLFEVMDEVVMTVRVVSYELDFLPKVPDPEEFMLQQRYLVQM